MGKRKINKSAAKRFRVSAGKKLMHRKIHQNHFNAKDDGDQRRKKRSSRRLSKNYRKDIKSIINI